MRVVSVPLEDARACLEAARFSGNHELADRLQGLIAISERETPSRMTYTDRESRLVADSDDSWVSEPGT